MYIRSPLVVSGFPRLVLVYSPPNILSANRSSLTSSNYLQVVTKPTLVYSLYYYLRLE